jgi:hypothetical protein
MSDKTNPKLIINNTSNSEAIFMEAMNKINRIAIALKEYLYEAETAHKISHGYKGVETDFKTPDAYTKKVKCVEAMGAMTVIDQEIGELEEQIKIIDSVKFKK